MPESLGVLSVEALKSPGFAIEDPLEPSSPTSDDAEVLVAVRSILEKDRGKSCNVLEQGFSINGW